MIHPLFSPCAQELAVRHLLQRRITALIQARGYSHQVLATQHGLLPVGVAVLLAKSWTISESLRIAEALDLPLSLTVISPQESSPRTTHAS